MNRTSIYNYWISVQKVFKTRLPIETSDEMARLPVYKGMSGDHAHLWLCFKPFLKSTDYVKLSILFVPNKYDYFLSFSLWLLKPNLVYSTKAYLPKHLTVISNITVKTTMLRNSPGIIILKPWNYIFQVTFCSLV